MHRKKQKHLLIFASCGKNLSADILNHGGHRNFSTSFKGLKQTVKKISVISASSVVKTSQLFLNDNNIIPTPKTRKVTDDHLFILDGASEVMLYRNNNTPITVKNNPITNLRSKILLFIVLSLIENDVEYDRYKQYDYAKPKWILIPPLIRICLFRCEAIYKTY